VWDAISVKMLNSGFNVRGTQCWTKWKALKVKYKQVKRHNNTTGNDRKDWEWLEVSVQTQYMH